MPNPYDILGVGRDASPDEIKAAYRRKASETHPDKGGSDAEAAAVNDAYALLSDATRRSKFDTTGDVSRAPTIDELARSELASLFNQALQALDFNPVEAVAAAIDRAALDTLADVQKASARRIKLTRLRDQLRGPVLLGVIDQELTRIDGQVERLRDKIKLIEATKALLAAGYSDEFGRWPSAGSPVSAMFITATTSATTT